MVRMGVASLPSDWDEVESGAVGTAWGPRGFHIVAGIVPFWDSLKNPARGCQRTASGRPQSRLRRESTLSADSEAGVRGL